MKGRKRTTATRCDRKGDYAVAGLVEKWGYDMALHDLAFQLSADCERRQTPSIYDRCDIVFAIGVNDHARK